MITTMKYKVYINCLVENDIEVEAESKEEAEIKGYAFAETLGRVVNVDVDVN